ncbi:tRNA (adenosine(37)-N6)-threonylcarbamoyltransferase complex ATPase subunit type 1 TsaE [Rhizobium sp. CFBP 8762]|uniref:tRNA (adenosine(37)-N6)-threonylcarbamoyltransferase complex ATPase subunit type 1 TsaE n=1 Tax=Rhizobium sp. CFBP 8762 TaxID=2775279 RepID=UPI0017857524|nr:tRNA (adenosine(37)-N6)-threonylcarbamoyltransferase complex ATPase subunit type 1 TsaE [Rhizobium sp. CFBP 8762]MBD8556786.1 tRNA (adenosine(37)-N6)-threonylcarbamoyltransferase complex ATPase subunit type 1 TsaE [Rhizobium sp. CFBP 8762]
MSPLSRFLPDEAATIQLGEDLALALKPGDCVALHGDLGAGKSTLARAFLRALADDADLEVPSPTFTLVQAYDLRIPVAHFDLYRLGDPSELDELGFDEALEDGICLVEWPDKADDRLPDQRVDLYITHEGDGRHLLIDAPAAARARIARSLDIRDFLAANGHANATRRHLSGDASSRAYERIGVDSDATPLILMDFATVAPGPILMDGKYYQQLAHISENVVPYLGLAAYLRQAGLAAPEVFASDISQGFVLLENLGADGILDAQGAPIASRYHESITCLAQLHSRPVEHTISTPSGIQHTIPDFDATAMRIETQLLIDWYLPWKRGKPATEVERQTYLGLWDQLIAMTQSSEKNLLLRDFHSPNIIWRDDRAGLDRVGIIDFQDAMIGPTAYDVASLTQDARVTIQPALAQSLLSAYTDARAALGPFDQQAFQREWHIMAAQRNCKLVGLWVRLMQRDGKPDYIRHMPRTLAYLRAALSHDALTPLRNWCIQTGLLPQ